MIEIKTVEKNSLLATNLLNFIKECSWLEVKDHMAQLVKSWDFTDWETMIVALDKDRIVGFASIMKTDYYPLPDIFPWVSSIFVTEDMRGNRISEKLIDYANEYLKAQNFDRSYIPSEFFGLYEKYGYTYVKDILNYGDELDHLFVKTF